MLMSASCLSSHFEAWQFADLFPSFSEGKNKVPLVLSCYVTVWSEEPTGTLA